MYLGAWEVLQGIQLCKGGIIGDLETFPVRQTQKAVSAVWLKEPLGLKRKAAFGVAMATLMAE